MKFKYEKWRPSAFIIIFGWFSVEATLKYMSGPCLAGVLFFWFWLFSTEVLLNSIFWTSACLYVCTSARLDVCTSARLHICTSARLHVCTCARLHVWTSARLQVCMSARLHVWLGWFSVETTLICLYVCTSVRLYVCMSVCVYVCMCVCVLSPTLALILLILDV